MHASPFDELASSYDRSFTHSTCGMTLRQRVWERAATLFPPGARILELGCGTGEDAVHLARAGRYVVALDASAEMIRLARLKAAAAGCGGRVEFHTRPIEALAEVSPHERFDGVFSNFGAINCVPDLPGLVGQLAERLAPGARMLLVPMGRYVPWEWAWFLARGDSTRAFRRLRAGGVEWRGLRVRYPTPGALARQLAPWFQVMRREALGVALPPSYAAGWLDAAPRRFALLRGLERATRRFTAALGDHYMLEAVRR